MKKYKVLLTGKNNTVIDDFFTHLGENFESLTTSSRYEDIINHLKYFSPDIFVYCLNCENYGDIKNIYAVMRQLEIDNVPLAIVGSDEDCDSFMQAVVNMPELVLVKPITVSAIESKIIDFLKEKQRIREENARAEEERLAQEEEERLALEKAASRKHVLVVDDDPRMLKLIKRYLREEYDVATALSGKIALKFLEKKETNLILLDYQMPEEDGPAVLEKIRANEAIKDIPVVFLTGITEREKIQKALVLKPQGYLLKPVERDKLLEIITNLIG